MELLKKGDKRDCRAKFKQQYLPKAQVDNSTYLPKSQFKQ